MLKTADNPTGTPIELYDSIRRDQGEFKAAASAAAFIASATRFFQSQEQA